jgi:hypothetical protein
MSDTILGHGNPNGALAGSIGQVYSDVDTTNLWKNVDGVTEWVGLFVPVGPGAAFSGLVSTPAATPVSTTGAVAWVVPVLANLQIYVEQGVLAVANTKDLAAGQTDRFTQACVDVVNDIRQAIQSYPGFVVSATANSIPPSLLGKACQMILCAMQGAYPALGLSNDQQKSFQKAYDVLELIRDGKYRPEMPADPVGSYAQGHPKVVIVRSTPRGSTARSLSGLEVGVGRGDRNDHGMPDGYGEL